ncbi:DUF2335 domain-containing protein [Streptomyces harbinensis]|uniref:DUF2335 domain-containing protein n=1 Tax=Streptomyces harbinensis TaxID=1176198 RepID=UPI000B83D648|nr:DUF2335 domain-containing protein [Streptomyces harbinensis]
MEQRGGGPEASDAPDSEADSRQNDLVPVQRSDESGSVAARAGDDSSVLEPEPSLGELQAIRRDVQLIRRETRQHRGPIPDPQTLGDYESAFPGLAERIVLMAERDQGHRHQVEKLEIQHAFQLSRGGQRTGFFALLVMASLAAYVAFLGHPEWAAAIAGANIVAVVGVFVTGQLRSRIGNAENDHGSEIPVPSDDALDRQSQHAVEGRPSADNGSANLDTRDAER